MATIRFSEGTTYRASFTLLDEIGVNIDLTGANLIFAAYVSTAPKVGTVTPFLLKTLDDDISITDIENGVLVITFNPSNTVDRAGVYDWELQLTEINGDIWEAGSGALVVQPARRLDD